MLVPAHNQSLQSKTPELESPGVSLIRF